MMAPAFSLCHALMISSSTRGFSRGGGCQGWTPLARGPFVCGGGGRGGTTRATASPDEYLSLSLAARGGEGETGAGAEGLTKIKKAKKKKKKRSGGDSSRIHPSVFHQQLSQNGGGPAGATLLVVGGGSGWRFRAAGVGEQLHLTAV